MLEPSQRLKREATRLGCDPNHIIMADLILSGYSDNEAYEIAYSERLGVGVQQKIAERERVLSSEGYKRAFEEKRNTRKYNTEDVQDRSKDDVLRDLNQMASKESDTKIKADLLMKIAEIKQMKKDLTTDGEDSVQFFLALSCYQCPLLQSYNNFLAEKNKGLPEEKWEITLRPDEMQRVIELSDTKIKKMRKAGD